MRLIDADALHERLSTLVQLCKTEKMTALLGRVLFIVEKMPTVGNWISVKDRLPTASGKYLAIDHNGISQCLFYSEKHKAFNAFDDLENNEYSIDVRYWMNIPEPPQEVTGDERGLRDDEKSGGYRKPVRVKVTDWAEGREYATYWVTLPEPPQEVTGDA